jgi:hypothetical protein
MQAAKNKCDGKRAKKLGIWMASKKSPRELAQQRTCIIRDLL